MGPGASHLPRFRSIHFKTDLDWNVSLVPAAAVKIAAIPDVLKESRTLSTQRSGDSGSSNGILNILDI